MLRIVEGNARSRIAANKPEIHPPTRSPLLARMATFMPTLEAANADLKHAAPPADAFIVEEQGEFSEHSVSLIQSQGASDNDCEDDSWRGDTLKHACLGDAEPRIEMNLTCGLLDLQNRAACSAAEATMQNGCNTEDTWARSVHIGALEQSPKVFVDGAAPCSNAHCERVLEHAGIACSAAAEGATCSAADNASGNGASCPDMVPDDTLRQPSKAMKCTLSS